MVFLSPGCVEMKTKPRAAVLTLGCKVNQFESAALADSLRAAGYEVTAGTSDADLVVLNTCTVTQKADQEALSLLRRLRRSAPGARLVVTGCLAEADPELLTAAGLADLVLGQADKNRLVSRLAAWDGGPGPAESGLDSPAPMSERTRAFYKIQDGCSAACAYCAVPRARGPARSLELDQVLTGLRSYLGRGVAEVVLCGIHLGRWGLDLAPPLTLAELLHILAGELELTAESGRLRLSSLEPLEADDELLAAFEMYDWLAPHFHLPLQSGSDRVLELMGRPYRRADFRKLLEKLNRAWPLASLGTDVMAGFPGETEDDLEQTLSLMEEVKFLYAYMYHYNPREGTAAYNLPNRIPEQIKRERLSRVIELQKKHTQELLKSRCGAEVTVLIEGISRKNADELVTRTEQDEMAVAPGKSSWIGRFGKLTLGPLSGNTFRARDLKLLEQTTSGGYI
jgi:MiaB/RimO family radical SAM methylthiotransferase